MFVSFVFFLLSFFSPFIFPSFLPSLLYPPLLFLSYIRRLPFSLFICFFRFPFPFLLSIILSFLPSLLLYLPLLIPLLHTSKLNHRTPKTSIISIISLFLILSLFHFFFLSSFLQSFLLSLFFICHYLLPFLHKSRLDHHNPPKNSITSSFFRLTIICGRNPSSPNHPSPASHRSLKTRG